MSASNVLESPALPLLIELEANGFRFRLEGERLLVRPVERLTPEQRRLLHQERAGVVMLVRICDAGVQDRREAFRQQLEATSPPETPAFLFRAGMSYTAGICFSCGDSLPEPRFGRCWRCSLAWRLACRLSI